MRKRISNCRVRAPNPRQTNITECKFRGQTQYFLIPAEARTCADVFRLVGAKIRSTREARRLRDFMGRVRTVTLRFVDDAAEQLRVTETTTQLPERRFILTLAE